MILNVIDSYPNIFQPYNSENYSRGALRFEDFPQESSKLSFISTQFEEIYNLIQSGTEILQDAVIEKFTLCHELSKRHFIIINVRGNEKTSMTFLHLAVLRGTEKIVDWFLNRFDHFEPFCIPKISSSRDKELSLVHPLYYLIEYCENNEKYGRIAHKLSLKWPYTIEKSCIYANPNIQEFWTSKKRLTQETIKQHKQQNSNIVLLDHLQRNGYSVHPENNVILYSASLGKYHILQGLLNVYSKKTEVIKTIDRSINEQLPVDKKLIPDLISIIHDYNPFIITPLVRNMATLMQDSPTLDCIMPNRNRSVYITPLLSALIGLRKTIKKFFISKDNHTGLSDIRNYIETIKYLFTIDNNQEQLPAIRELNDKTHSIQDTCTHEFFFHYQFNIISNIFRSCPNFLNHLKTKEMEELIKEIKKKKSYYT